jgi:hypothetical protein
VLSPFRRACIVAGLFAAATCLLFACASHPKSARAQGTQAILAEMRGAALVEIKDEARSREVSALIEQLAEQDRLARSAVAIYRTRLLALNADYDATEEDFHKLFSDFNNERLAHQTRIVELWTEMASLTTDAEWDALGKVRIAAAKALSARG